MMFAAIVTALALVVLVAISMSITFVILFILAGGVAFAAAMARIKF